MTKKLSEIQITFRLDFGCSVFRHSLHFGNHVSRSSFYFQYAFFAYKTGNFGPAFDVLTDIRRVSRSTKFTTNLKLLILTDVGRLHDALLVIRSELLPSRDAIHKSNINEGDTGHEEVNKVERVNAQYTSNV